MKPKSLAQLLLFGVIAIFWLKIAWDSLTKEAAFFGAILGITLHWALTNKGNKNVVYIKPLTAGWRVLIYDMLFLTCLIALYQTAGNFSAFLSSLAALNERTVLLAAILAGIITDYLVGG